MLGPESLCIWLDLSDHLIARKFHMRELDLFQCRGLAFRRVGSPTRPQHVILTLVKLSDEPCEPFCMTND